MDCQVIHGDCLDVLPTLAAGSVDAVVTDPPYGIDYRHANGASPSEKRRSDTVVLWPSIANDDRPRGEWLVECFRVLRPGGALYLCCRQDVEPEWRGMVTAAGFVFKQRLVWHKRVHGKGDLEGAWAGTCEDVLFATRGRHLLLERLSMLLDVGCVPTWERRHHPHQKPVALPRRLVRASVPPGGLVLDPFAGSGTTGVACLAEGRRCILIEQNAGYCEIARKRLAEASGPLFAHAQQTLFAHTNGD